MDLSEKFISIAENEQRAADANAQLEQILYGTDTGGKSYYDLFWDACQDNGKRASYMSAFTCQGWKDANFKPKYDIKPTGNCSQMFYLCYISKLDLRSEPFKERFGVEIDMTGATNYYMFASSCDAVAVGVIDVTNTGTSGLNSAFSSFRGHTIEKIIMPSEVQTSFNMTNAFNNCNNLVSICFEGVIGVSINFQWSPLSRASLENIVEHLSPTVTGQTVTFKRSAVESAFGIDLNDTSTYTEEFREWRQSRYNWTYSYV